MSKMYACVKCPKTFETEKSRSIHSSKAHGISEHKCSRCGKQFNRQFNRKRHEESCGKNLICKVCELCFTNTYEGRRHEGECGVVAEKRSLVEPTNNEIPYAEGIAPYETAFNNRLKSFLFRSDKCFLDCYLLDVKDKLKSVILSSLKEHRSVKVNIVAECMFKNTLCEMKNESFKTRNHPIFQTSDLDQIIIDKFKKLKDEMEELQLKGSGWSLYGVGGVHLRINKYNPLRGSSYIALPYNITNRKACVNVQNKDEKCFLYSVLTPLSKDHNNYRPSCYKKLEHSYDFTNVSFPTPLSDIPKFEKRNNISINVFGLDENHNVYPVKVVKDEKEDHRDLLVLNDDSGKIHYVFIKDFNKLVRAQLTKHEEKIKICKRCFTFFNGQNAIEKLKNHLRLCQMEKPTIIQMPVENPILKFNSYNKLIKLPIVIYADFESILLPYQGCEPNNNQSFTLPYQNHQPMSFGLFVKMSEDVKTLNINLPKSPIIYEGKNAAERFMQTLINIAMEISKLYSRNEPMKPLSEEERVCSEEANICELCKKPFTKEDWKVLDHCHLTGKFRQVLHNSCNLTCKRPKYIPVILHNLSGYDSHFIVKQLGCDSKRVDVIPNNSEKYVSFIKHVGTVSLRFIDSYRFMPSSLEKLVNNLPRYPETENYFGTEKSYLMTRKGVFPYDYIDNWDKLKEIKLPPKSAFFSTLSGTDISDEDYSHAISVWNTFKLETLSDYAKLYLKSDVLLLCDVFESFRDSIMKTHRIDPAHYYTCPGMTWDAMLLYTAIELELMQEYDQILMVENGIRGGMCQVSHRYAAANNKFMPDYDPAKASSFITYEDCNNQYGWAMSQPLPFGGFQWLDDPSSIDLDKLRSDDDHGYILEVDIDYPQHLFSLHNMLPFLPENICPPGSKQKKLIPHLGSRKHYVVHYMTLKNALSHGLKLTKIHRALKFKQSCWLKSYIDLNNHLRQQATNVFEKDLFKGMNNSCYGKTLERIKNRIDIRLVTNEKVVEKLVAKPNFLDRTIYGPNLGAIHLAKERIVYNKPVFVGICVLEVSKQLMYNYHYDVMLPYYGPERLTLMYIDTDSFIYKIMTENVFEDKLDRLDYLDTSNVIPGVCLPCVNKGVLGLFKDEVAGKIIKRFVGLRAKMYAIDILGEEACKKVKGIVRSAVKSSITFEDFVNVLNTSRANLTKMNIIRSKDHDIKSYLVNKVSLSPFDDKRIIMSDGISTRAHNYSEEIICC